MKYSEIYWGHVVGEDDPILMDCFIDEPLIKVKSQLPDFVIGSPGIGKSAIARRLSKDLSESGVFTELVNVGGGDAITKIRKALGGDLTSSREELVLLLQLFIYTSFLRRVNKEDSVLNKSVKWKNAKKRAVNEKNAEQDIAENFISYSRTVTSLLSSNNQALSKELEDVLEEKVDFRNIRSEFGSTIQGNNKIVFLVDGLDISVISFDEICEIVRGFAIASRGIYSDFNVDKSKIQIQIYLRSEIYDLFLETKIKEPRKYSSKVQITWTEENLMDFLRRRILYNLEKNNEKYGVENDGVKDYLDLIFPDSIGRWSRQKWLCDNADWNPRELLALVQAYTNNSSSDTPNSDAFKLALPSFVKESVNDRCKAFEAKYPDLLKLLKRIRACNLDLGLEMSGDEFEILFSEKLSNLVLLNSQKEYLLPWNYEKLLELLHDLGFVGFRVGKEYHFKVATRNSYKGDFRFSSVIIRYFTEDYSLNIPKTSKSSRKKIRKNKKS